MFGEIWGDRRPLGFVWKICCVLFVDHAGWKKSLCLPEAAEPKMLLGGGAAPPNSPNAPAEKQKIIGAFFDVLEAGEAAISCLFGPGWNTAPWI